MSYEPEPAPGLSELEDRHQLQRHAHILGYVAVPEALWERTRKALAALTPLLNKDLCWCSDFDSDSHTESCLYARDTYRDLRLQQEVIERERS